ncbi:FAD-dependent oxidoreductase [Haloechinothrix sp. YIM 98757]|uniref:FAD-dependent oxidoreductase n=1 Tax=Haloechinothrix aidingensis TaxID=2752311 RepID=A0A838ABD5_9PSEU|nr:FAD-dependent oxidoreductase [Haloechinothrix aidingensis]MBA0126547.1 FAD-dependent oxidoreductase [Haloechinothrix aidingensis]
MNGTRVVAPLQACEVERFDEVTDVLVIGYGCAGASAAFEAARSGADVLVVERASGAGGSSGLAGGELYLGGGTRVQRACGFDDSPEAMARFLQEALGPGADAEKITAYSEHSVEHFDWLVARGIGFKPSMWDEPAWVPPTDDGLMWMGENSWPYNELARPAPRGHRPAAAGFGGWLLMERLAGAADGRGVRTHYDTSATRLVVHSDRSVLGAVVRRYGSDYTVRARRGVVLTTGGFVDNDAMLALHAPHLLEHGKNSDGSDDGSGIRMAQAAGAAVKHMSAAQVGIALIPPMVARGVLVNGYGQRFINEDTYPGLIGHAALQRQHMNVWVIVDEDAYEAVPEEQRWGVRPYHVTDDLAELEEAISVPPGALRSTVEVYDEYAARGEDPYFHKAARWLRPLRAPYAAVEVRSGLRPPSASGGNAGRQARGTGASVFTTGGLHTSVDGHVLDIDGAAVPGLFAAGRASCGMHGSGYVSGTSLGDGTFFGRRAGRAAAAR